MKNACVLDHYAFDYDKSELQQEEVLDFILNRLLIKLQEALKQPSIDPRTRPRRKLFAARLFVVGGDPVESSGVTRGWPGGGAEPLHWVFEPPTQIFTFINLNLKLMKF